MPSFMHLRVALLASGVCVFGLAARESCASQAVGITAQQHAQRADAALRTGHPEQAIPEFQALVDIDPTNVDAQANLGVLQYFHGDVVHGVEHMRRATQLAGSLPRIQALLGMGEASLGQTEAAQADLQSAFTSLANDPTQSKLRRDVGLKLVEIEQARDQRAAAAETLRLLNEAMPNDPEVLYAMYRVYTDLAGESLLNLSLEAPKSGQMQQAIAHELLRVRDLPGAIASFRRAIAADPRLPGIHFELAEALHGSDSNPDKVQAEAEYELALKQDPSQVEAAAKLGDIHFERGDLDGAAKFYQQTLDKQPGNADAALGMSRVFSEHNENDKALALLQGVVKTDPGNVLAHYRLSALFRKMHRPEDAKRELADYQRIKDLKERLHEVYSSMKIAAPHNADADTTGADAKRGAKP